MVDDLLHGSGVLSCWCSESESEVVKEAVPVLHFCTYTSGFTGLVESITHHNTGNRENLC